MRGLGKLSEISDQEAGSKDNAEARRFAEKGGRETESRVSSGAEAQISRAAECRS